MLALITEIVEWLGPVFATAGYPIIATAVLLDRSIMIGLIAPGETVLALGGIYAARGDLSLAWVMVIGVVGAAVGESVGYWLGSRYGRALLRKFPLANRLERRMKAAEEHFEKRGGLTVAVGRFATAAGAFVPFVAGMSRMRYQSFLAFDAPAVVVWAVGVSFIGYVFGTQLELVESIVSRFGWIMLALLVVYVGWVIYRRRRSAR